jgi:hypothetical protein
MEYKYILRIAGAEPAEVTRVLGRAPSDDVGHWNLVLKEGPEDVPTPFLDVFFEVLDGHIESLERMGVSRDDITVWLLYEYDEQCNLEFSAADMKRLGDAGISLCISCWRGPEKSLVLDQQG